MAQMCVYFHMCCVHRDDGVDAKADEYVHYHRVASIGVLTLGSRD